MRPLMERVQARKLELQGVARIDLQTSIDAVASAVTMEQPDLRPHTAPDGTVTILFSDNEATRLRGLAQRSRKTVSLLKGLPQFGQLRGNLGRRRQDFRSGDRVF